MASRMNTSCNTCGKEVPATYLGKHYQRYHKLNAKVFSCDDCDNKYFEKRRLEHHVIASHNRIIPHDNLCIECGKTFVSAERLGEHKSIMHTIEEMTLSREVCKKKFRNNKVFKAHSRNYHLELPCTDCEKKFGSRMALKAHMKAKHAE